MSLGRYTRTTIALILSTVKLAEASPGILQRVTGFLKGGGLSNLLLGGNLLSDFFDDEDNYRQVT